MPREAATALVGVRPSRAVPAWGWRWKAARSTPGGCVLFARILRHLDQDDAVLPQNGLVLAEMPAIGSFQVRVPRAREESQDGRSIGQAAIAGFDEDCNSRAAVRHWGRFLPECLRRLAVLAAGIGSQAQRQWNACPSYRQANRMNADSADGRRPSGLSRLFRDWPCPAASLRCKFQGRLLH